VLYVALPTAYCVVLHIYAINSTAGRDARLYECPPGECPIYKKPRRTDLEFICFIDLKTSVPADHWTLRGTALLCDTA